MSRLDPLALAVRARTMTGCVRPDTHTDVQVYLLLLSGRAVLRQLYDATRIRIEGFIPSMEFGESYTVRQMCGPEFWRELEGYEPRLVGYCVVDMVLRGLLPLEFAGRTSANARLYRRK